jgi:hypothetical protein
MSQATADSSQNQTADGEANALASDSIQEITPTPEAGNSQGGSGEVGQPQGNPTPSIEDRVSNVGTPEEYEAMMAEAQQNPQMFDVVSEEPIEQEEQEAEAPESEEQEVPEEQEEEAEAPVPEADDDDEEEDDPPEEKPKSNTQFRLRPSEKLDVEAFKVMKAAEAAQSPISMTHALEIAKRTLGIVDKAPSKDQNPDDKGDTEPEDDATSGITLPEAKQELRDLRKKHTQALRDGDLDEAADAMDQISETEDLIEVVSAREVANEKSARSKHDTDFQSSVAKAADTFPDFGDEKSDFYERCTEIDQALRDTEDPRYYEAGKPLMIAQMAARELNIAPGSRTKAKPAKAPAPPVNTQQASTSPQPPRTERPGQLPAASGASRTASAPTGAAASLANQVETINSPADFERIALEFHSASR